MIKKRKSTFRQKFVRFLQSVPPDVKRRLVGIVVILLIFNIGIWFYTFFSSLSHPVLLGLVTLAYGLGLRHAVDVDHIAAIDNVTRKLMQDGQKPIGVGFFFSLGHSTIVILLSLLIGISSSFISSNLPAFKETGSFIGTAVSSIFLLVIGIINIVIFWDIVKIWRHVTKGGKYHHDTIEKHLNNRGFFTRLLKPLLKTVHNSKNMYIIGFLFGLGFDTASEVGLLSISAATGASGMSFVTILLLPLAFTAGMTLIDTLDGILMLCAYGWAYINPIRKLYYNMNITFISIVIALFIGGIEGLQIMSSQLKLHGKVFDFINSLNFGNMGYIIIGTFLFSWIVSMIIYKLKGYDLME
jgi:nickel/cobalt transporter (NiCoT) family protein